MLAGNKHKLCAKDWHVRLGHTSIGSMQKLVKLVDGIDLTEKECVDIENMCEICIKANQTRSPFLHRTQKG